MSPAWARGRRPPRPTARPPAAQACPRAPSRTSGAIAPNDTRRIGGDRVQRAQAGLERRDVRGRGGVGLRHDEPCRRPRPADRLGVAVERREPADGVDGRHDRLDATKWWRQHAARRRASTAPAPGRPRPWSRRRRGGRPRARRARGGRARRAARRGRSPRSVQQTQPLRRTTVRSSTCRTRWWSIAISPSSLTSTPFPPCPGGASSAEISVVLPLPRKPVTSDDREPVSHRRRSAATSAGSSGSSGRPARRSASRPQRRRGRGRPRRGPCRRAARRRVPPQSLSVTPEAGEHAADASACATPGRGARRRPGSAQCSVRRAPQSGHMR